ncbi:hypothetical protein ES703_32453 [subsurface metagenome]
MQTEENQETREGGLEHIGKVLEKVTSSPDSMLLNQDQTNRVTKTEDCQCEECGSTFLGEVTIYKRFTPPREIRPHFCQKCRAEIQEREERKKQQELKRQWQELGSRWRRECGMPAELLTKNFQSFERDYQKVAYKVAMDWAKSFNLDSPHGYPSLIFYSNIPGVGKGHLMAAIINYALENWQGDPERKRCPIRFESGPSLVRRIRATYNLRKEDELHEREDEVYQSLAGVPLLLLDDVGKESPSNFTRETYWYIIDERVKSGLPVIISSRLEFEGERSLRTLMGEDTVSRLYGMTRGEFIKMKGQDYRRLKGIP